MKELIIVICIILLFSCSNKTEDSPESMSSHGTEMGSNRYGDLSGQQDGGGEIGVKQVPEEKTRIKESVYGEYERKYLGTIYITKIIDDRVNIRSLPSLEGTVVAQLNTDDIIAVTGISKSADLIDDHQGYWLKIYQLEGDPEQYKLPLGWVFSMYVSELSDLESEQLSFASDNKNSGTLKIKAGDKEYTVYLNKLGSQDFYSFVWTDDWNDFRYSYIPGTYIWYPSTNEIKHITYKGETLEAGWAVFTDDFRYMLQDYGTGPGTRAIGVFNLVTNESIFSGSYYSNINLEGYEIDIIYSYTDWDIKEGRIDDETEQYALKYLADNKIEKRTDCLEDTLIVKYRYNFNEKIRTFTGCEVIVTQ